MAKRRRLSPAQPEYLKAAPNGRLETKPTVPADHMRAPISHVVGDAAAAAALREVSEELRSVREGGRLVLSVPLEMIDPDYLVRDRLVPDEDSLTPLVSSIRSRGQQIPIEAINLGAGRYGLISGWRRLTALKRLLAETGDARFSTILVLQRQPETTSDAYLAMVEENEIRAGLSYYERARIVARATEMSVFPDEATALRRLFASASRSRRSKIGSFLPIYHALDARLSFPAAIPERLGLALSKVLSTDPTFGPRLGDRLREATPGDAGAEMSILSRAITEARRPAIAPPDEPTATDQVGPEIVLVRTPGGCRLTGPGVDSSFLIRLQSWLSGGAGL